MRSKYVTYEEAASFQAKIEDKLLEDPNILSVGVVEATDTLGRPTGGYVIQVGVASIEVYQNAIEHGRSIIPKEYLIPSQDGQKHLLVTVVKEGKIEALLPKNPADVPSAIDEIPATQASNINSQTTRMRPSPAGQSIGHKKVTAGTFGLLLTYESGSNVGKVYILSNNHVLAASNAAYVGDPIIQPGVHDQGVPGQDTIATLHRWVPLNQQGNNYVDAAVAEVLGGDKDWGKYVIPDVTKIGIPSDVLDPAIGMKVEKTGRTTGYTQGKIESINETIKVTYTFGQAKFKHQIRTTNMSQGGDSGSGLFEQGTRKSVGLLFAGSQTASFFNPMKKVLSSLSESHTNSYVSGKPHVFSKDDPFKILKRKYSTTAYSSQPMTYTRMTSICQNRMLSRPTVKSANLLGRFGIYGRTAAATTTVAAIGAAALTGVICGKR